MVKTSGFKKKKKKTLGFHCRGHEVYPWLGNKDPICHGGQPKKKGKRESKMSASINPSIYTVIPLSLSLGFCYILDPVLGLGT